MTEEKKTDRWVKSLDKAGLLDPIEDSWEMQESDSGQEGVIVIDKRDTDAPLPSSDKEPSPSAALPDLPQSQKGTAAKSTDPATPLELTVEELRRQMTERFDVGDYSGALQVADKVLELEPEADDASMIRLRSRGTLMQMYESRIGSLKKIPVCAVSQEDIMWRNMDATSAFIAANIDGIVTFEDIIDISTVSRFDTCRILSRLLQEGIIK